MEIYGLLKDLQETTKQAAFKAVSDMVDQRMGAARLIETKEEACRWVGKAVLAVTKLAEPLLTPLLAKQLAADPFGFLAGKDEQSEKPDSALEAWSLVKKDCDTKLVEMQAFFDKKFADAMDKLAEHQEFVKVRQRQEMLEAKVDGNEGRILKVEKAAESACSGIRDVVVGLNAEEKARSKVAGGQGRLDQVLTDLITTIATGAEAQIGQIRVLVMYLAGTVKEHAEEAGMSRSTWSECVMDTLTQFRHSQEKRLTRNEIFGIVKRLALANKHEQLYEKLKKVVNESDYEASNFEAFKFQTWARCAKHRATNKEEKMSVKRKKAIRVDKEDSLEREMAPAPKKKKQSKNREHGGNEGARESKKAEKPSSSGRTKWEKLADKMDSAYNSIKESESAKRKSCALNSSEEDELLQNSEESSSDAE